MASEIQNLSKYSLNDSEKMSLIDDVLEEFREAHVLRAPELRFDYKAEYSLQEDSIPCDEKAVLLKDSDLLEEPTKYCPECGRKYPEGENVCFDCLVHLKNISDKIEISQIEYTPQFTFKGKHSFDAFDELLSMDNLSKINQFRFSIEDYSQIIHSIKLQALKNFDDIVKSNEIDFDELEILDKIILFAKSFVNVKYKSSGPQLGYFEDNTIFIDDRQTDSLQITTLIHELSHFIIQEILVGIVCKILDASRCDFIESVVSFILSYTPFTQLIDEYSAHNVEGRFTIFGFQDYSSYLQIESELDGEMSREEIEITKSIGNTFALTIKDVLESLIDRELREDIKDQFMSDVLDRPNYAALRMENCQILNDEGFIKSIWLILNDGFEVATSNMDYFTKNL